MAEPEHSAAGLRARLQKVRAKRASSIPAPPPLGLVAARGLNVAKVPRMSVPTIPPEWVPPPPGAGAAAAAETAAGAPLESAAQIAPAPVVAEASAAAAPVVAEVPGEPPPVVELQVVELPVQAQPANPSPPTEAVEPVLFADAGVQEPADARLTARDVILGYSADCALEVNLGAVTESNLYVGFSDDVQSGGVFVQTYEPQPLGSTVRLEITLPGPHVLHARGTVRFVRDDLLSDAAPGLGVRFEELTEEGLDLLRHFARQREPIFYDDSDCA